MLYFWCLSLFLMLTILDGIVAKSLIRVYEKAKLPYSTAKIIVGANDDHKYEHFLMATSKKIEIKMLETCGDQMFPHGIYIDSMSHKPMMYCEPHKCFKPQHIYCQKNILSSQCKSANQWIAGIHTNLKNRTYYNTLITVDCCQYKGVSSGKFVKQLNLSTNDNFIHEITVKEGRLINFNHVNNLRMDKVSNNLTVLELDVYEMVCPTEPSQLTTYDNFVKNDMLGPQPKYKEILVYDTNIFDDNSSNINQPSKDIWNPYFGRKNSFVINEFGVRMGENAAQIENSCGMTGFPHGFFIDMITAFPRMYCKSWPSCFHDPNKIICARDTGTMRCETENEWIAGFIPNNGLIEIECCHYKDINSATFVRNSTLGVLDIFTHEIYRKKNHALIGFTYVNGLTKEKNGEVTYTASVYRMNCPRINNREFNARLKASQTKKNVSYHKTD